jgi:hypothetical protein
MFLKELFRPVIDGWNYLRFAILFALLVLVAGCSYLSGFIDPAREFAGKGAAIAAEGECALSSDQRLANLTSVNGYLATNGSQVRVLALDCDGDGSPDVLEPAQ